MKPFYSLENSIQTYAWGSKNGISAFTGITNSENKPMAELWMGAHPGSPSKVITGDTLDSISLADLIAKDPVAALGKNAARKFDGKLPFLFKVLSAGAPLSIQVHPSRSQAIDGFARENKAGIPVTAGERNYKDNNHKPEIIMAVTPFTAMCGFREKNETIKLLKLVNSPELKPLLDILVQNEPYTSFCRELLGLPQTAQKTVISAFMVNAKEIAANHTDDTVRRAYALVTKLSTYYPADIGILSPLYLNVIELNPGEAIYLPSGVMHAYIEGTGLELMANSDNVLRGGLTPKHIDIPELLSILNSIPFKPVIIKPGKHCGFFSYRTESQEFELSCIAPESGKAEFNAVHPAILIGATGEIRATAHNGESFILTRGKTAFVPALGENIVFTGTGTAYIASIPE